MECNFTLKHYQECVSLAKDKGYTFVLLKDYKAHKNKDKVIFMSHDVDWYLHLVPNFLNIERDLGVKSTYFLRLHSKNYNLFTVKNYKIIQDILRNKNEVGLHYEPGFNQLMKEENNQLLKRERTVLENIINHEVCGFSPHEPATVGFLTKMDIIAAGFKYHAHDDDLVRDLKYITDSGCRWREGCMCNWIKNEEPRLYIVTHPIWWYNKTRLENY